MYLRSDLASSSTILHALICLGDVNLDVNSQLHQQIRVNVCIRTERNFIPHRTKNNASAEPDTQSLDLEKTICDLLLIYSIFVYFGGQREKCRSHIWPVEHSALSASFCLSSYIRPSCQLITNASPWTSKETTFLRRQFPFIDLDSISKPLMILIPTTPHMCIAQIRQTTSQPPEIHAFLVQQSVMQCQNTNLCNFP